MKNNPTVTIIGAGLAGSEAAFICARAGVHVKLYEMKPVKYSPAHHSENFAELVCSNSLRAAARENAIGLLKEELRHLGSLIMEAADKSALPAGGALAVDRDEFSVFSNESVLCIWWPKYWNFRFSIVLPNEYSGLISFSMD